MISVLHWNDVKDGLPEKDGKFIYVTTNGKINVRNGKLDEWFVNKYSVKLYSDQPDTEHLLLY